MHVKSSLALLLSCFSLLAIAEQCVLQEKTVARSQVTIAERSTIRRDVVPAINGGKKCMVDLRVRVGLEWYTTFGEHTWPGDMPTDQACAVAVARAEDSVRDRVGRIQTTSEKTLICNDRPELSPLRNTKTGLVGDAGQFRMHPNYPNRFYHNGAQCRWFLEPEFTGRDIRAFQGVVCEVQGGKWVVVDKF